MNLSTSILGKTTDYKDVYDPSLLFSIPRFDKRKELGLKESNIPFFGVDIWNAYEISWLNQKGKPCVAIGEFYISAESVNIIESKSLKLYLNSFNNTKFNSIEEVEKTILKDLNKSIDGVVKVRLFPLDKEINIVKLGGKNIDHLEVSCTTYNGANKALIEYEDEIVKEEINSNLLKSNCLVTGQPDWGSVSIKYEGKKLKHETVLKYLVSFRNHNEFHEQCVERIFIDIFNTTLPSFLEVYARYTRRGGLDISPYRTTDQLFKMPSNGRLVRQ